MSTTLLLNLALTKMIIANNKLPFLIHRKAARVLLTMDQTDPRRLFEGKQREIFTGYFEQD